MKSTLLLSQIILASGLLFVNVYNSIVDARSWGAAIPQSLQVARQYAFRYNPANFFKYLGPVYLIIVLGNVISLWSISGSRLYLVIALILAIFTDVLTVSYFFPRNDILFRSGDLNDIAKIRKTWLEWSRMNWVRSGLMVGCLFLTASAFKTIFLKI